MKGNFSQDFVSWHNGFSDVRRANDNNGMTTLFENGANSAHDVVHINEIPLNKLGSRGGIHRELFENRTTDIEVF